MVSQRIETCSLLFAQDTLFARRDYSHREETKEVEEKTFTSIGISQNEIGKVIHKSITDSGFSPVRNLSGHSIDQFQIHSGITIRNYDDGNDGVLPEGAYAIEPFATTGQGEVYEGDESSIYHLIKGIGKPRDPFAREILAWIQENKQTLPFSERELESEFKKSVRIALKRLVEAGIIKSFPRLIEKAHKPVCQAEHTLLITKDNVEIITA